MKVEFDKSFKKVLEKLIKKDKKQKDELQKIIDELISKIQAAESIRDLYKSGIDIVKLKQTVKNAQFRIKEGCYRIGVKLQNDTIIFLWINRRDERTYL